MSTIVRQYVRQFGQRLVRRRGEDTIKESDGLKIHLSATELVFLGVGRNLGAGLYIVLGAVAKYVAGPAIVVSFLVAGLSSLLSRLCYVEFDARVPRSSSALCLQLCHDGTALGLRRWLEHHTVIFNW